MHKHTRIALASLDENNDNQLCKLKSNQESNVTFDSKAFTYKSVTVSMFGHGGLTARLALPNGGAKLRLLKHLCIHIIMGFIVQITLRIDKLFNQYTTFK